MWVHSNVMKVSGKFAQRPAHQLGERWDPIPGLAFDVADHLILFDLVEIASASGANFKQKATFRRQMMLDGLCIQTALALQIGAKLGENLLLRRVHRNRCRRNCAGTTQN